MRMRRTLPFFPPKSRENPYLEVLSRFGLWRDFLNNNNKQTTISVFRLVKTCQLMPNPWNFTSATLNRIRCVFFFYHNIKDNERNHCQDLLTQTSKCTRCIMQMGDLYASDFPFKHLCTLAQHGETIRKKCLRVQKTTINHISILTFVCFLPQYQRQRKCGFFFSERELKKALRDTLTQAAWYGL